MSTEFRKTGISVVGDIPWGTHFCHFYQTKQDLFDTLVPYFKAGLGSGEFCLWVVSDSDMITVGEAEHALRQSVPDLDRHLANRNIEIVGGHDWYNEKDAFNLERVISAWDAKLESALALGYEGMRISGDTFWLGEKDRRDFSRYERQFNDSIRDRRITALCTYPLAKSKAYEILDVVQTHQFATARREGQWQVIETPELLRAKAEIKRLNDELRQVAEPSPAPDVILRYALTVLSVIAVTLIAIEMRMLVGEQSTPIVALFLCGIMFSAWYGGSRSGILAIALSLLAFKYYFATPYHSIAVNLNEIPRLIIFSLSGLFVVFLSAAERRSTESLRRARDVLDRTVTELKQTNAMLRSENAERSRAEELLNAKEQEFRAIVENAPDQIIRYDREFRRTYANPAVARAYGLPPGALTDKLIGSVIRDGPTDIKGDELTEIRQRLADVFDTGEPCEYELTWAMPAGPQYFNVRLFPELDLNGSVVNVLAISRDITERKQTEERLQKTTEQLRALSARIQFAKEEEGTRIAREIHDELGSALTSLRWDLEEIDEGISEAADQPKLQNLRTKIEAMMTLIDTTVGTVQRISSELRPPAMDTLGLIDAIEWQARQFEERTGMSVACDSSLENVDLSREQSIAVFRIFQEALTNILRHAGASRVYIEMNREGAEFILTIRDDGKGITEDEKSGVRTLGLLGMHERAHLFGGKIDISGTEGKGTVVTVRIPIPG